MAAQITTLPTPPSRQDPSNFNDRADTFLGALPTFQSEANALSTEVNTRADNVQASANAVLAATNITKWVSGTTYAEGAVVWSPINGLGYRRITASGSGTTDPSLDTANYKQVNGTGDVSTSGNQSIAGFKTFSNEINASSGLQATYVQATSFSLNSAGTANFTPGEVLVYTQSTDNNSTKAASTAYVNNKIPAALNASGAAPIYAARAWVNFSGTGTVSIRASGNVSSITDNGVGDYTVNFTTAMPDANYCTVGSCRRGLPSGDTNADFSFPLNGTYSTSAVQVRTQSYNDRANVDADIVNITIFR